MAGRSRDREAIAVGAARIVTCVDETGPALVILPSYGRDSLGDFDRFTDGIVEGAGAC